MSNPTRKLKLGGGTLSGQLNFSGTNHAGLKLLSLTTTQRDALTPANGMMIYNTTNARVENYSDSAWAAVTPDATDIYELTASTDGASTSELLVNGASQMIVPAHTAWDFSISMMARRIIFGETWTARDSSRFWSCIACSSDGTKLVAGNSPGNLYSSSDSGATWTSRATSETWTGLATSSDGLICYGCAHNEYIQKSTDSGATWSNANGSYNPSWSCIACSSDGTKLVAGTDGGKIYTSTDSGATLTERDSNRAWRGVCSSSDGTKLAACVYGGQIYTSTNSGATWTARESSRNWIDIKCSSDGVYLIAQLDSYSIYKSSDSGVTWSLVDTGGTSGIAVSATGKRMVSGGKLSYDYGATWVAHGGAGYSQICCDSTGTKLAAADYGSTLFTSSPTSSIQASSLIGTINRNESANSVSLGDVQQNDKTQVTLGFSVSADTSTGALKLSGTGASSQQWDWKASATITSLTTE